MIPCTASTVDILTKGIEEVKANSMETSTKFEKFVDAMWKPAKCYIDQQTKMRSQGMTSWGDPGVSQLYGLIAGAVKAAGMDS